VIREARVSRVSLPFRNYTPCHISERKVKFFKKTDKYGLLRQSLVLILRAGFEVGILRPGALPLANDSTQLPGGRTLTAGRAGFRAGEVQTIMPGGFGGHFPAGENRPLIEIPQRLDRQVQGGTAPGMCKQKETKHLYFEVYLIAYQFQRGIFQKLIPIFPFPPAFRTPFKSLSLILLAVSLIHFERQS